MSHFSGEMKLIVVDVWLVSFSGRVVNWNVASSDLGFFFFSFCVDLWADFCDKISMTLNDWLSLVKHCWMIRFWHLNVHKKILNQFSLIPIPREAKCMERNWLILVLNNSSFSLQWIGDSSCCTVYVMASREEWVSNGVHQGPGFWSIQCGAVPFVFPNCVGVKRANFGDGILIIHWWFSYYFHFDALSLIAFQYIRWL